MTQTTRPASSGTPTIVSKAGPTLDDYVPLGASTSIRFNSHKGLKKLRFDDRMHHIDAYFICANLADGILTNAQETSERLSLRQRVSDSYYGTFATPDTPEILRTRCVLKALLLSFRLIVLDGPGDRRKGCIIEWSQAPSAAAFPLNCVFRDAETRQTSRVMLEAETIDAADMSQGVLKLHYPFESPSNTRVRGGDTPTESPPMPLKLPLRCMGSFKSSADLALLAWAVHHHFPNAPQFANCVDLGDAIGIYSKIPEGLLDGWTKEDRGSEEEEEGLFRFYTPKQVTENGPICMSTANYAFGARPLFFVSFTFRESHRCRPTQNKAILENFEPKAVRALLRVLSIYGDGLGLEEADVVSLACMSALPYIMEAAKDEKRADEVLQSFQELTGGILILKKLTQDMSSSSGQMAGRIRSLVREVEFIVLKHLLQTRG